MSVPRSIFQAILTVGVFVLGALVAFSASAEFVKIKLPDGSIIGTYLYKPSGKGSYPAVIVLHHAGGLTDHIKDFTRELSNENFVTTAVEYASESTWPSVKVGAVYDYLQKLPEVDPERIGVLGFSRGALEGMRMAFKWQTESPIRPIRALVSYYIGRGAGWPKPETPPILFLHGDRDVETGSGEVVAVCEKLKQIGNVCEAKIYKGTGHAFTHESRYGEYDAQVSADAYKRAVAFLNKYVRDAPIK